MGSTLDECLGHHLRALGSTDATRQTGASGPARQAGAAQKRPYGLGERSRRLSLLASVVAHALLLLGVLCGHGLKQKPGLESVITVEFADPSGLPGQGVGGGAQAVGTVRKLEEAKAKSAAFTTRPPAAAAVNIANNTSRQQAETAQKQPEVSLSQGMKIADAGAASASSGPAAGMPGGSGQGSGGAQGGIHGGTGSGDAGGKVDSLPRILEKVKPLYPEHARRRHKTGVVTLKFLVDAEGRVHHPSVIEANPPGYFEESALAAIARWRFAPALRQDRPVPTWLILPVRFTLEQ